MQEYYGGTERVSLFDYFFTTFAVILGALLLGIGSEIGKDVYKLFLRERFIRWAEYTHRGHLVVKNALIKK